MKVTNQFTAANIKPVFYCAVCKKPKPMKQMSNETFIGEPMCKHCAKGRG